MIPILELTGSDFKIMLNMFNKVEKRLKTSLENWTL